MAEHSKLAELKHALVELEEEKVLAITGQLCRDSGDLFQIMEALQDGIAEVGRLFEKKEYFLNELVFSAEIFNGAMAIVKPHIKVARNEKKLGKVLLGTVMEDVHDIGKNIVRDLLEANGFDVLDLGVDVPEKTFIEQAKAYQPDIIGLSGVLTIAVESMKSTIKALEEAGVRDKVKVIIGGNPVDSWACKYVKADGYTNNASEGIEICKKWVGAAK